METTVRETIKNTTKKHLKENNGLLFGQCLSAVGWVGGTVPELTEKDGLVELSMADVANGGIVAGAGLSKRRPIYVIRYQGFNWFNASIILNYACKSKEIWDVPCPIFIRGIAMEGSIGPVAGSSHHSLYYRMPGVRILSPMTVKKYFHIGIAVDTEHGLMVPKIRNVDKKNINEISDELRIVSDQCRKLKVDKKEFRHILVLKSKCDISAIILILIILYFHLHPSIYEF